MSRETRYYLGTMQAEPVSDHWLITIDWHEGDKFQELNWYTTVPPYTGDPDSLRDLINDWQILFGQSCRIQWQQCVVPQLPTRLRELYDAE